LEKKILECCRLEEYGDGDGRLVVSEILVASGVMVAIIGSCINHRFFFFIIIIGFHRILLHLSLIVVPFLVLVGRLLLVIGFHRIEGGIVNGSSFSSAWSRSIL